MTKVKDGLVRFWEDLRADQKIFRAFVAVTVVAAVLAGVLAWSLLRDTSTDLTTLSEDAEDAAGKVAEAISTYRWDTLDADLAWANEFATPEFRETYGEIFEHLRQTVTDLQSTATAEIRSVQSHGLTMQVEVEVSQSIHRGVDGETRTNDERLLLTMVWDDDSESWLVDNLVRLAD